MGSCRTPLVLAVVLAAAVCGGGERAETPIPNVTEDSADMVSVIRRDTGDARSEAAGSATPAARATPDQPPSRLPDTADGGRPLLVVVYHPEMLDLLNSGDAWILLEPVMGYVGEVGAPDAPPAFSDDTAPWVNRVEWSSEAQAFAMVRDTAAALGIRAGDTWWVVGPSGPVRAPLAATRPGLNGCGRRGGVAVTFGGEVSSLPPGAYYATSDSAAAIRVRVIPPEQAGPVAPPGAVAALDTDGDGAVDTVLGEHELRQGRADGREYLVADPRWGGC